eukprot:scaffold96375_cov65-Phaeocystis_antarctica.AAC.1
MILCCEGVLSKRTVEGYFQVARSLRTRNRSARARSARFHSSPARASWLRLDPRASELRVKQ